MLVSVTLFVILNFRECKSLALLFFNQVASELHVCFNLIKDFDVDVIFRNFCLDAINDFNFLFFEILNKLSDHCFIFISDFSQFFTFSFKHICKDWLFRIIFISLLVFFDTSLGPFLDSSSDYCLDFSRRFFVFSFGILLVLLCQLCEFNNFVFISFFISSFLTLLQNFIILILNSFLIDASFKSRFLFASKDNNNFRCSSCFE